MLDLSIGTVINPLEDHNMMPKKSMSLDEGEFYVIEQSKG
jgi:hypothetical protein